MKNLFSCVLLALMPALLMAQKKPLAITDFDGWQYLTNVEISKDGSYIFWEKNPQEGDGILYLLNRKTNDTAQFERGKNAQFMLNASFLVFKILPKDEDVRTAKRKKAKKDDMPKSHMALYNLQTGKLDTIKNVSSYSVPKQNGRTIAAFVEDKKEDKTTVTTKVAEEKNTEKPSKKKRGKSKNAAAPETKKQGKPEGKTLMLITLGDLTVYDEIKFVADFWASDYDVPTLFYSREKGNDTYPKGLFSYDVKLQKATLIDSAYKEIGGISANKMHTRLAYITTQDTAKSDIQYQTVMVWDGEKSQKMLDTATTNLADGWMPSADFKPLFDEDGRYLLVGTKPIPKIYAKDTLALDEEKVHLDIWHYQDYEIQPQQNLNAKRAAKKSYLARIDLADSGFLQIENLDFDVRLTSRDTLVEWQTGSSNKAYQFMNTYMLPTPQDIYMVSLKTGEQRLVKKGERASLMASPKGNFGVWFDGKTRQWYSYDLATKTTNNISQKIPFAVYDEQNDVPDEPNAYGQAGWIGDTVLVIYDRYDLWAINLKTNVPKKLTDGRKDFVRYYIQNVVDDVNALNQKTWVLSAFNDKTKDEFLAFYNTETGEVTAATTPANYAYNSVAKAKDADVFVYRKGNFVAYPELYVADGNLQNAQQLTNTNPQQADFNWGTVEMVSWKAFNGKNLQGLLYKPEDFDSTKAYPMIVYFYETYSDRINQYYTPAPSASTVNFSYYASNGYLVFVPDIVYKTGQPGKDAYDCIVSGANMLAKKSWVNAKKIGLQGQSWGGYQTAFLITQTNQFACAMAGAPVSNMTSAYGGIRWGSGYSRQFQYELTQSRLGATLWENRELYIKNSPVFFADKVQTPLLIMHNDEDGAVPWYQGIEYFMAMRRLQKPAWMLVYNGEDHNLMKRHNRKDLSLRMAQFFDVYLKDAPAPEWMSVGRKAVEKDSNPAFEVLPTTED